MNWNWNTNKKLTPPKHQHPQTYIYALRGKCRFFLILQIMGLLPLLVGAGGIYASFLYYGSLQEDVLRYSDLNGNQFTYCWFLQLAKTSSMSAAPETEVQISLDFLFLQQPRVGGEFWQQKSDSGFFKKWLRQIDSILKAFFASFADF